jgi:nucleotide-binding universal stress UspA family protein
MPVWRRRDGWRAPITHGAPAILSLTAEGDPSARHFQEQGMPIFQSILVAADLSEGSREAFRAACSLAHDGEARVVVLNVLEPRYLPEGPVYVGQQTIRYLRVPRDRADHESMEERLREVYAPARPLEVEYRTTEGEAAEEILRVAGEVQGDLIAMGTHGRTGLRRLLAGSIAEAVLRKAPCPVVALRGQEPPRRDDSIRVILHPTDFSASSEAALEVARLLARDHGARLVLLHVTPLDVALEGALVAGGNPQADLDSLQALRTRVEGPDLKFKVDVRLAEGDAAVETLRIAEDFGADLIVMGTHGRSGMSRLLMGSQAEAVLRRARGPVLVVKDQVPAGQPAAGNLTRA